MSEIFHRTELEDDRLILRYKENDYYWVILASQVTPVLIISLRSQIEQTGIAKLTLSEAYTNFIGCVERIVVRWWEWAFAARMHSTIFRVQRFAISRIEASYSPMELYIKALKHSPTSYFLKSWAVEKGRWGEFAQIHESVLAAKMLSE